MYFTMFAWSLAGAESFYQHLLLNYSGMKSLACKNILMPALKITTHSVVLVSVLVPVAPSMILVCVLSHAMEIGRGILHPVHEAALRTGSQSASHVFVRIFLIGCNDKCIVPSSAALAVTEV